MVIKRIDFVTHTYFHAVYIRGGTHMVFPGQAKQKCLSGFFPWAHLGIVIPKLLALCRPQSHLIWLLAELYA